MKIFIGEFSLSMQLHMAKTFSCIHMYNYVCTYVCSYVPLRSAVFSSNVIFPK